MLRFGLNRCWTLILALCLATASTLHATKVRAASADPGSAETTDPATPGGTASGDPDMPDGPGRAGKTRVWAQRQAGPGYTGVHSVGDGMSSGSALMWKVRVTMLGLRKFYLFF
jgi:hypothetical protein